MVTETQNQTSLRFLEQALSYQFRDPSLLREALTHRSFGSPNNERLEFLGDAVLDTIVAQMLYSEDAGASEGLLTRHRAALVNGKQLAQLAVKIRLNEAVIMGLGERNGEVKESILEGAFEAIVGATFLDSSYEDCYRVFAGLLEPVIKAANFDEEMKDSKTRLQELMQAKHNRLPQYKLVEATGPDHAKKFLVSVEIYDPPNSAQGFGSSRKIAEQEAARQLLENLDLFE